MNDSIEQLPYRNNVSIIPVKNHKFLLAHHIGDPDNWWKFPQGGVDICEDVVTAGIREFYEEIGTNKIRVIGMSKYTNTYDWPIEIIKKSNYTYKGQTQRFILVEVLANESEIKPDKTEIEDVIWVSKEELLQHHLNNEHPLFKKFYTYNDTLEKIFEEFKDVLFDSPNVD